MTDVLLEMKKKRFRGQIRETFNDRLARRSNTNAECPWLLLPTTSAKPSLLALGNDMSRALPEKCLAFGDLLGVQLTIGTSPRVSLTATHLSCQSLTQLENPMDSSCRHRALSGLEDSS